MRNNIFKVIRFIKIYGVFRTASKVVGRIRPNFKFWLILKFPFYSRKGKKVGIVGCGHQSFSSIAYFLTTSTNCKIEFALDIDEKASKSLAKAYDTLDIGSNYNPESLNISTPDLVYIASNHASHTDYAIKFLDYGCDLYIEKPVSINSEQINNLSNAVKKSKQKVYVGYNRPHSPAMRIIKSEYIDDETPFTLSCFISGHLISEDHWYRDPSEGTRIVANVGHWIDLMTHVFFWAQKLPDYLDISILYSDLKTPSDNIAISIASSNHDLINITFTSRSEPFEGVNETINFQKNHLIAKIDDFRTTKIWNKQKYKKYNHWPKNAGHKQSVLQPFNEIISRDWKEIELSTRLMLFIEEMALTKLKQSRFKLAT